MIKTIFAKHTIGFLGIFFGLVFSLLLAIRLDLITFKRSPSLDISAAFKESGIPDSESWMNIFLKKQKIGYTHRWIKKTGDGFVLKDKTYLKMNIMGMVQELFIETSGRLNHDFSLSSFTFDLSSGAIHFVADGKVQNNMLYLTLGEEDITLPSKDPIYLYAGLIYALKIKDHSNDKVLTVYAFDPLSATKEPVTIQTVVKETLNLNGKTIEATKLNIRYKGLTQNAWIDNAGNILQESGPMGMRLVKTQKEKALHGFNITQLDDLTESMSVASNIPLDQQDKLTNLSLKLSGIQDIFNINGGRQKFENSILTISREHLQTTDPDNLPILKDFLRASPLIQSDHEKIIRIVSQITHPSDSPELKAEKILNWIYENIEKRPVLSVPNALETLKNREGDCNEHAVLFAAMARAADIPTQIESGMVYLKGRFYYHAWNVLYLTHWVTADATMGQMPADVTHIRLIRGEMGNQMDLVHAIGNLKIEILESTYDSVN